MGYRPIRPVSKEKNQDMAGHDDTPSILEAEACMPVSLRLACLYGKFQDSQGYTVRPCLKTKLLG